MTGMVRTRLVDEFTADDPVGAGIRQCWIDVSNAGGAVGFPFPPVSEVAVRDATVRLARDVAAGSVLLFVAEYEGAIAGWVSLRCNGSPLTSHWATVERLQSRPDRRGLGVGRRLMESLTEHATSIGLAHLRLQLRGGENLEGFYTGLGWREIGRHPAALRLADNDDRDEVSMLLDLSAD